MDNDQIQQDDSATDNTNEHPTPDQALEPQDDIYNPNRDEEKLEGDNDSPAAPPSDVPRDPNLPEDHPEFDYNKDTHETYDQGEAAATGAEDQKENNQEPPRPLDQQG